MVVLLGDARHFISVDTTGARDGDIARLQYPSVHLEAGACLHVEYMLIGHVQLEVGYQLDLQSDAALLLCTLVPNSTHIGWFSTDIVLPAGHYQLYFDAIILSLQDRPVVAVDSIKLLDENCTRIIFTGKSTHLFCCVLSRRRSEGWSHHGSTFSIYLCPLILIDSSTGVLSTS